MRGIMLASCALVVGLAQLAAAQDVKITGDLRYRYENIDAEGSTVYWRQRIRARVNLEAEANDDLKLKARLATGSADPVSTNQTLGDGFTSKDWKLDYAYFDWTLTPSADAKLKLLGGKMKNPFFLPQGSGLIWDGDLTPEGLTFTYGSPKSDGLFAAAGVYLLDADGKHKGGEDSPSLGGAQFGVKVNGLVAGASLYNYVNLKGEQVLVDGGDGFGNITVTDDNGTPADASDDFEVYTTEFSLVNVFAEYKMKLGTSEMPLSVFVDFVMNAAAEEDNMGYAAGVAYGQTKNPGEFKVGVMYRVLEKDATIGAFADSDFGGGGTNNSGILVKLGLGLAKHAELGVTYFLNTVDPDGAETEYTRGQVDLAFKF